MSAAKKSVVVVGAGWAGLAAAFTLARKNYMVTLLEAAPKAGGRARAVSFGQEVVDNGQHLFLGAYEQTRTLLSWLKIPEESVFFRKTLDFYSLDLHNPEKFLQLTFPKIPAPWHLLSGFIQCSGFTLKERLQALKAGLYLTSSHFKLSEDISVLALLHRLKQPERLIHHFWSPLTLAALSTPIERASAEIFHKTIKKAFSKSENSNWLFPKKDLSELLPNPILKFLKNGSHSIFFHQRVESLLIENGICTGVKTASNRFSGKVILATPPNVTATLLSKQKETQMQCHSLIQNLTKFTHEPITTVYFRYPRPLQLKKPMIALVNGIGQWVFDRGFSGQPHLLSVIVTGEIPETYCSSESLIKRLTKELHIHFPKLGAPVEFRVISEKRAAFSCEVGISRHRPTNATPILDLYLAGDYTATGYPATLESAISSGIQSAKLVSYDTI